MGEGSWELVDGGPVGPGGLMAKINIGLRIPALHPADPIAIRRFVQAAERLGFHSIWAGDHVFYHVDVIQPLQLLSWIAALTSRVRLGTAVMLSSYLNPVLLAKAAASLDCLSGGRLILGMSIGGSEAEFRSIGVPMDQRVGRLVEATEILRRLFQEDEVTYEGRYHRLEHATIKPKPVQQPGVPLLFGGTSEAMLRRIGRLADGWVCGSSSSLESFAEGIAVVREEASRRGRDPDSLEFAKLHCVSVAADRTQAAALAEAHWKTYYGSRYTIETVIHGTTAECAEQLRRFGEIDLPAMTLILETSTLGLDQLESLRTAIRDLV